jgi:hypothetical protein
MLRLAAIVLSCDDLVEDVTHLERAMGSGCLQLRLGTRKHERGLTSVMSLWTFK